MPGRSARHHRWSGKKLLSGHGYVKVRVGRAHPLADPNGYAYEHLVVWVAAGNERPARGWVLHHRNGVKTENLEVVGRGAHNAHHNEERRRLAEPIPARGKQGLWRFDLPEGVL